VIDPEELRQVISSKEIDLPKVARQAAGPNSALIFGELPENAALCAAEIEGLLPVLKSNGIRVLGVPKPRDVVAAAEEAAMTTALNAMALAATDAFGDFIGMRRVIATTIGVARSDIDGPNSQLADRAESMGFEVVYLPLYGDRQWERWGDDLFAAHQRKGAGVVALLSPTSAASLSDVGPHRTCAGSLALHGMNVTTGTFVGGRSGWATTVIDAAQMAGRAGDLFAVDLHAYNASHDQDTDGRLFGGGTDYLIHLPQLTQELPPNSRFDKGQEM
jgi:hypothetical protein